MVDQVSIKHPSSIGLPATAGGEMVVWGSASLGRAALSLFLPLCFLSWQSRKKGQSGVSLHEAAPHTSLLVPQRMKTLSEKCSPDSSNTTCPESRNVSVNVSLRLLKA